MTSRLQRLALAATATAALLLTTACSGDEGGDASEARDAPAAASEVEAADGQGAALEDARAADEAHLTTTLRNGAQRKASVPERQAVISKGTVSLESDDVADVRFEVQKVVDRHDGSVSSQETTTDDDGRLATARLVLRVPAADFGTVIAAIEELAVLTASTSSTEDVTTRVIDTEVRIRAQRRSLERIEALLAQATDLREIVMIEGELTRRQAELDSLTRQQAWLQDQTSQSTITVHVERPDAKPQPDDDDEGTGFLAGLEQGWAGLVSGLGVALTVLGFLLPFLLLAALLGLPLWLVLRRRRGQSAPQAQMP
jgi:hypothetical protein